MSNNSAGSLTASIEASIAFLAGPLLGAWEPDTDGVDADCFVAPEHKQAWEAEVSLRRRGEPVVMASLKSEIMRLGYAPSSFTLSSIASCVPTSGAKVYAGVMREHAKRERLAATLANYAQQLRSGLGDGDDLIAEAESAVYQAAHPAKQRGGGVQIQDALASAFERVTKRYENPDKVWGVPTGIAALDELCGGFRAGELVLIAARPGEGKTTLAQNYGANVALRYRPDGPNGKGRGVIMFSLEMTADELAERWLASEGRVNSWKIRTGKGLTETDWQGMAEAWRRANDARLTIVDDMDVTPGGIASRIRGIASRMEREGTPLGLVIVDYLQLVRAVEGRGVGNREQEIAKISRALKAAAKEFKVPVVALSQLNREVEKRADRRPQKSDLRESGSLEQDANTIIFIYRPDPENAPEDAELIVDKQRNGPTGSVKVRYRADVMTFEDLRP